MKMHLSLNPIKFLKLEPILTANEAKAAEKYTITEKKTPSFSLMQKAGKIIAQTTINIAKKNQKKPKIFVVCGGNNAGDG